MEVFGTIEEVGYLIFYVNLHFRSFQLSEVSPIISRLEALLDFYLGMLYKQYACMRKEIQICQKSQP